MDESYESSLLSVLSPNDLILGFTELLKNGGHLQPFVIIKFAVVYSRLWFT